MSNPANEAAEMIRDGLLFLEETQANAVAGKVSFTWPMKDAATPASNAASFACVASMLERGVQIEIGGNLVTIALTLFVRRDLFHTADSLWLTADSEEVLNDAPLPTSGKVLQFKGVAYKVLLVGDAGDHSHLKITLGDLNSGK